MDKLSTSIYIDANAIVNPDVYIGYGTKIWNWTKVREKVSIGNSCNIGQCVYLDSGIKIGDRCKIQNGVQIYQGVTIGSDVFIGPNVTFTNDKYPRAFNIDWQITKTEIKDHVSIGAGAVIVCGITIEQYSMIGAGAVVTKNVEPYMLVLGNPARVVGRINENGELVERY